MPFTPTQIFLSGFLLFALSRVFLRYKGGSLPFFGFIFWSVIFSFAIVIILFPFLTGDLAQSIGIGRGVDAVIYISIALLFYLVFRLYIFIEDVKQDITDLVRKIALKDIKKRKKGKE